MVDVVVGVSGVVGTVGWVVVGVGGHSVVEVGLVDDVVLDEPPLAQGSLVVDVVLDDGVLDDGVNVGSTVVVELAEGAAALVVADLGVT